MTNKTPVYEAHMYLRRQLEFAVGDDLDRIGEYYGVLRRENVDSVYRGMIRYVIDTRIIKDKDL